MINSLNPFPHFVFLLLYMYVSYYLDFFYAEKSESVLFHTSISSFRIFFLLLYLFLGISAKERRTLYIYMEIRLQFWFIP